MSVEEFIRRHRTVAWHSPQFQVPKSVEATRFFGELFLLTPLAEQILPLGFAVFVA